MYNDDNKMAYGVTYNLYHEQKTREKKPKAMS